MSDEDVDLTVGDIKDKFDELQNEIDETKEKIPDDDEIPDFAEIDKQTQEIVAEQLYHYVSEDCDTEACSEIRKELADFGFEDVEDDHDHEESGDDDSDESDAEADADDADEPEAEETDDTPANAAFPDEL